MKKRRYAALTMVRDEDFFLRIWHRYYAREFGAENLFIIDHNSQVTPPEAIVGSKANILRLPFDNPIIDPDAARRKFDDVRFKFISAQIASLLHYYDCIILNDVDELFIPNTPSGTTLRTYLDSVPEIDHRAGMGVEIFHDAKNEPAYDLNIPLFTQRKNFRYRLNFCKPWVIGKPVEITGHGAFGPFHIDPNLLLLHLHHVDQDILLDRREQRMEAFSQGRGGQKSRWSHDLLQAKNQLQAMADTPVSPEDMPHPQILETLFSNYRNQTFSGEHYTRHSGKRINLYEVDKFVCPKDKRKINTKRYQFHKRFEIIEV